MSTKVDKSIYVNPEEVASRRRFYRVVRSLPAGVYAVSLTRKQAKTFDNQRGYYWGYLLPEVGKAIGYGREKTDRILATQFLTETCIIEGKPIAVALSTSELTPDQAEHYYGAIRVWAWRTLRLKLDTREAYGKQLRAAAVVADQA